MDTIQRQYLVFLSESSTIPLYFSYHMETENTTKPEVTLFSVVLMGAIMAILGNLAIFFIAKILQVSPSVPIALNNSVLKPLSVGAVIVASAFPAFGAGFMYFLMKKLFASPLKTFLTVAAGFLILSLGAPIQLPISVGQKIILCLMHVVAALFVVGSLVAYHNYKTRKADAT